MQRSRPRLLGASPILVTVATCLGLASAWGLLGRAWSQPPCLGSSGSSSQDSMVAPRTPVVVRASETGPCIISGVAEIDPIHPAYLTALRYERAGGSWVVSDFVNVDLGEERAFMIQGLTPGRWFIGARGFMDDAPAWGRSEPIELSLEHPSARTSIALERYEVQVVVAGVPEDLRDDVYLSMEWVEADRIQVEADEFLDLPQTECPRTDAFQTFGTLQSVGTIWIAADPARDGEEDASELLLDPSVDPWGLDHRRLSWIKPSWDEPLSLPMRGPGSVTITLHGIPGLEDSIVESVELTRSSATGALELRVDMNTLQLREAFF